MAEPTGNGDAPLRVVDRALSEEMHDSYMQYAMSVIKSRALPDVRDGLKPSQRRVLYAMHELNLPPNRPRVKSARVVGDCMGRFHPHGDQAIYMTLVRMAQDFASRYTLVDKKGNFGSISDPTPAAMRYTECRMTAAAVDMVDEIGSDTVEMVDNYDGREKEPVVLPSKFPNLLCNGSQGIAVGMATSIPPHNLREVCAALTALVHDPKLSDAELFKLIPGPDFPTGGVICGRAGIREAYLTGRGAITVRGKVEIATAKDRSTITIREVPYQVTTELLKEKIQEAYKQGRIEGISALKDHSAAGVMQIVVECKKGEDPDVILNQLYKFTPLQSTFSVIMIALDRERDRDRPRTFALRELLEAFANHRFEVVRRRTQFQLRKCLARVHILLGLAAAIDQIDAVIELIRRSGSTDEAREGLIGLLRYTNRKGEEVPITARQANAILDMRLQRLTGLERGKLTSELDDQRRTAADLEDILARRERVVEIFVRELEEMRTKYGDDRRTQITDDEAGDIDIEDLIADEEVIVTITHQGYIKRTELGAYRVQARAGKGLLGAATREDDFVTQIFQASTKDALLCFTNEGRVHWLKIYQTPEGSRTARGKTLRSLVALLPEEQVTSVIPVRGEFDEGRFLVMATHQGVIKKTTLAAFGRPKKGGIIAVKLDEGDQLVGVKITDGQRELVLATIDGKAIRFHEDTVRAMGRASRGVRGMTLEDADRICSLVVVGEDGPELLSVCESGHGKRTPVEDYRATNRGGKGIINIRTEGRNGNVVGVVAVKPDEQVMLMTTGGKSIRSPVADISTMGRNTQGVRIIRVEEGEKVAAVAKLLVADPEAAAAEPVGGEGAEE